MDHLSSDNVALRFFSDIPSISKMLPEVSELFAYSNNIIHRASEYVNNTKEKYAR